MLYLFSSVGQGHRIPAERIQKCSRLCREWESIVAYKSGLRKVFVSIKGIYYQAEIAGQRITWMVPHQFTYPVPDDVDIRVMLSFLEFYESLMSFILFKLFHDEDIPYPPPTLPLGNPYPCSLNFSLAKPIQPLPNPPTKSIQKSSSSSSSSQTETQKRTENRLKSLSGKMGNILEKDMGEEKDENVVQSESEDEIEYLEPPHPLGSLFSNCSILLSREVPFTSLEFCIKSCGGKVSWKPLEEAPTPSPFSDDEATHHVVDRPMQNHIFLDRNYIQPQWVYDCINTGILLPVEDYLPGQPLPPHLSPFVNDQQEGYIPDQRKRLDALIAKSKSETFEMEEEVDKDDAAIVKEAEVDLEQKYQEELNREILGIPFSEGSVAATAEEESLGKKATKLVDSHPKEEEDDELASIMIPSKKKRRLYQRIQYSEKSKKRKTENLERKKEELSNK
jgi:pescadillo protein